MYTIQLILQFSQLSLLQCTWMVETTPIIAPSPWEIRAPPNTLFPWPTWVFVPNWISVGSAVSPQLTRDSAYTLQWSGTCPPKLPLPHLIHGSCGWPIDSTTQTAYRLVHPFLSNEQTHKHTQTDRPRYIDLCTRWGLIILIINQRLRFVILWPTYGALNAA